MAFDFIDMIIDTKDEYMTGYYYPSRFIENDTTGRVTFKYKQADPNASFFSTLLNNLRADRATYAIKTNDLCGFKIGGYVVTQNGKIWEIVEIITNEEVETSNNVLRWFKTAKNAETYIRMLQVNDLYTVRDAYFVGCKFEISFVNLYGEGVNITTAYVNQRIGNAVETINDAEIEANVLRFMSNKGASIQLTIQFNTGISRQYVIGSASTTESVYETTILVG